MHVEITALQPESVVSVNGSKAHVKGTHVVVEAFHAQVNVVDPVKGVFIHSNADVIPPQVEGLVLH